MHAAKHVAANNHLSPPDDSNRPRVPPSEEINRLLAFPALASTPSSITTRPINHPPRKPISTPPLPPILRYRYFLFLFFLKKIALFSISDINRDDDNSASRQRCFAAGSLK